MWTNNGNSELGALVCSLADLLKDFRDSEKFNHDLANKALLPHWKERERVYKECADKLAYVLRRA